MILAGKLKGLTCSIDIDEGLVMDCKRSQLGQVFTNLMSNAADAVVEKHGQVAEAPQSASKST